MDLNKKILLDLYPDYKYICGPYLRKDGRKQITLIGNNNCSMCGKKFKPSANQHNTRSLSKAGPFCSKQCSGLYGAQVQNGAPKINRQKIYKEYYQLKKL